MKEILTLALKVSAVISSVIITVTLYAGIGYFGYLMYQAPEARREEVRQKLSELGSQRVEAIQLAKSHATFIDPQKIVDEMKGDIQIIGWEAHKARETAILSHPERPKAMENFNRAFVNLNEALAELKKIDILKGKVGFSRLLSKYYWLESLLSNVKNRDEVVSQVLRNKN